MLVVDNLVKEYNGSPVVRGVSFTVRPGQITAYLGPNGAGKSTTVKSIVGLVQPTQGHIEVAGVDVRRDPVAAKRKLGYAPENGAVYGTLSPREFLWLVAELHHVERMVGEQRIGQMLQAFSLTEAANRPLETLSRGQRQKVLLIAALLHDPEVILLDEPLQGLDANAVRAFRQILEQLAAKGKTILFCSHILDVVERLCQRVIVLDQGRIVADDTTANLLRTAPRGTLEEVFSKLTRGADVEDGVREFLTAFEAPGEEVTRLNRLLTWAGIEPRAFAALVANFVVMDLRGQHFAQATLTKPNHVISPLFWVVGQCLALSASASLFLFARVDVYFFAFIGLGVTWLLIGTLLLVEFDEVVLAPRDADVLGHLPIAPRTLAAARLANLFFYVGLFWLALTIFPAIVGAGLRDAGWLYAPAYLLASIAGTCVIVTLTVSLVSFVREPKQLDHIKTILAWSQMALLGIFFYGGQYMLRDDAFAIQTWAANPPTWVAWLPPAWLGRYVEQAAVEPGGPTLAIGLLLILVAIIALSLLLVRLTQTETLSSSPSTRTTTVTSAHPANLGRWPWRWLLGSAEERVGFWLTRLMLRRDGSLWMRCLVPFHFPAVLLLLALLLRHAADSDEAAQAAEILAILSVYATTLALATAVHPLASCRDYRGGWLLRGAAAPTARGAVKALLVFLAMPCSLAFGVGWTYYWGDAQRALIAFVTAAAWCLPGALAGLWLLLPAPPLTLAPVRGGSLGLPPLPLLGLVIVMGTLTGLHRQFAGHALFWICLAGAWCITMAVLTWKARVQLARLDRPE